MTTADPQRGESDLLAELESARDEVARLERLVATGPCREYGHSWKLLGGANAGCGPDCGCSVAVLECTKCGDCDYGDTERESVQRKCAEDQP